MWELGRELGNEVVGDSLGQTEVYTSGVPCAGVLQVPAGLIIQLFTIIE